MTKKQTIISLGLAAFVVAFAIVTNVGDDASADTPKQQIWKEFPAPRIDSTFNPGTGFAPLVREVEPTVVNINTTMKVGRHRFPGTGNDFWMRFFGGMPMPPAERQSLGSGVIINPDGYILTNNHVVENASEIKVKTTKPELELPARIIGRDEKMDLALIKVDTPEKLPAAVFGNSDDLEVGEWVVAIGSPYGLARTVTAGIVSAKDRVIGAGPYDDFIQTDASINPGNSGGPLFNVKGLVVGINTAIHAAGQGIGFAVPIQMAKKFVDDVMTQGRVSRGWLGVGIQELTPEIARGMGVPMTRGVIISQVYENSPAEKAGMKIGDIVTKFNGADVAQPQQLVRYAGLTSPNTTVPVEVYRKDKTITLKITVVEREEDKPVIASPGVPEEKGVSSILGMNIRAVRPLEARKAGVREGYGVLVTGIDPAGPGAVAGLYEGDIIVEVNRTPVRDGESFTKVLKKIRSGETVLLLTVRDGNYLYRVIRKPR